MFHHNNNCIIFLDECSQFDLLARDCIHKGYTWNVYNEGWYHVTSSAKRLLWGNWLNCLLLINPFISSFWSSFLNEHDNLKPALFLGVFPANVMVTLSHVIQWQVFAIAKTTRLVTTVRHAKKVSMEIQLKVPKMTANHVHANMAPVAFW